MQALSIQAHPSVEEAASAPAGTYGDGWAKPEAWYALTDFEVFAGLRPFDDTRALAELLDVEALTGHVAAATEAPEPARALLATLLHLSSDEQAELADAVVEACRPLAPAEPALDAVVRIAEQHPRDIGLVVLLVMRHVVLRPGDYAFVDAGVLHAGVRGVVVEILANSDNVVRAGLTPSTSTSTSCCASPTSTGRSSPSAGCSTRAGPASPRARRTSCCAPPPWRPTRCRSRPTDGRASCSRSTPPSRSSGRRPPCASPPARGASWRRATGRTCERPPPPRRARPPTPPARASSWPPPATPDRPRPPGSA
ncbi:hypothetical protein [Barrientosiimonas endolithica]|uniref:hypothetical protein n=1 Tax=Barrientosiimonas endolithica TaxID=1535208 RepID=UPI003D9B8A6D